MMELPQIFKSVVLIALTFAFCVPANAENWSAAKVQCAVDIAPDEFSEDIYDAFLSQLSDENATMVWEKQLETALRKCTAGEELEEAELTEYAFLVLAAHVKIVSTERLIRLGFDPKEFDALLIPELKTQPLDEFIRERSSGLNQIRPKVKQQVLELLSNGKVDVREAALPLAMYVVGLIGELSVDPEP